MQHIDTSVYRSRITRAQEALRERSIAALLLGPSADLTYLTGFDAHHSERMNLLILPADAEPSLVIPTLEASLVGDAADLVTLHDWADQDRPAELAASILGNVAGKTLAVGNQLWSAFLLRLQAELRGATWVEGDSVLRELRMIKEPVEISYLAEAASLTDLAWEEFIRSGQISGLTELQALQRLLDISTAQGLSKASGIVGSGPNSASPHHSGDDRVIQSGDAVVFDWGGRINGYFSDVTRSVHVGEPGEEYRRVYEIVKRANQATFETIKPGVPLQELDRTARTLITGEGYGDAFLHRVGHGLGMEIHEEPYLVEGNDLPLASGMVFSDEPGIYLSGRFGVRIEDTVVCTEEGGRYLNNATRELVVMK
ncbi:MAG TPA: Xaa-Pro peptidase family protein [Thermomicrobiales bacterium]|nr:Xaa-Pro peptidase family protein [Thermomicrobiales bacterium]